MCCGNDGLIEADAVAALEGPMERTHRVFTTKPGDVRQIGSYGQASNDAPALVSAEVAAELDGAQGLRVEIVVTLAPGTYTAEEMQEAVVQAAPGLTVKTLKRASKGER